MTMLASVMEPLEISGSRDKAADRRQALETLARVGLPPEFGNASRTSFPAARSSGSTSPAC